MLWHSCKLILDGQQRSTALFMALFSGQPVWIKEKKSQKIQERWYYIDIEKALVQVAVKGVRKTTSDRAHTTVSEKF